MVPAPRAGAHTESRFGRQIQVKSTKNVALHFRENTTPHPTKSMTYTTTNHANCRRWVKEAGVPRSAELRCRVLLETGDLPSRPASAFAGAKFLRTAAPPSETIR